MSADDNIKALRDAGHEDAAVLLEQRAAAAERQEAARSGPGTPAGATPGIRLVSDAALSQDDASRQEGEVVLSALKRSGVGDSFKSAGSLFGGDAA